METRLVGLIEAELSKRSLGTRATQPTLPAGPTSTTTIFHVDSVPQRERACLDLFWTV